MLAYCKPLVTVGNVIFFKAFDDDFSLMLREKKYRTLAYMKTNADEVEANRAVSIKLIEKEEKEKRKLMDIMEASSSSKIKDEEHKIDEITSMLRNSSN